MNPDELKQLLARYNAAVDRLRREARIANTSQADLERILNEAELRFVASAGMPVEQAQQTIRAEEARASGASEEEVERARLYAGDSEDLSRVGRKARQFVQGATWGFGDELRGIAGALTPGGQGKWLSREAYIADRDRSRAGVEQFRRERPIEAAGLEVAGGLASGLGGTAAAARAGLSGARTAMLARGAASANPITSGLAKTAQTGARALSSPSALKRGVSGGLLSAGQGATYGLDTRGSLALDAGASGLLGGALYASPVGRMVARSVRERSGPLGPTPPVPTQINIPGTGTSVPLSQTIQRLYGGARDKIFRPLLETRPERIRRTRGVDDVEIMGQQIARQVQPTIGLEAAVRTPVQPILGQGSQFWTRASERVGRILQRPKVTESALTKNVDDVSSTVYGPLEQLYKQGSRITDDNIDEVIRVSGSALSPERIRAMADDGLLQLQDFIKSVVGNEQTRNLIKVPMMNLGQNLDAVFVVPPGGLGPKATVNFAVHGKRTPAQDALEGIVNTTAKSFRFGDDTVTELSSDPRYVVRLVDALRKGEVPDLQSMQAFRQSLRSSARKGNKVAEQMSSELDAIMRQVYPGLNVADDLFRQARNVEEVAKLGRGTGRQVGLQNVPDEVLANLSRSQDILKGKQSATALRQVVDWIEGTVARSSSEKALLSSAFLDGHFNAHVISPLLKNDPKKAAEMFRYLQGQEGQNLLQQYMRTIKDPSVRRKITETLLEDLRFLSSKITDPDGRSTMRNLIIGAIVGGIATKVFGTNKSLNPDPNRPTF